MPLGVYIACDDPLVAESLTDAIGRDPDCYVAAVAGDADVVIARPHAVPESPAALVVLACGDAVSAARFALARGADGIAEWPDDRVSLSQILHQAAARKTPAAAGMIVSVVGARGGAGATTIAAHLAAALGPDALLVDLRGGAAGQGLYAASEPAVTLTGAAAVVAEPSVRALTAIAAAHAAGVPCLYGGEAPPKPGEAFAACMRGMARVVVADGPITEADVTVVVCGADVGSVRSAAAMSPAGCVDVVLNGAGRIRARDVRRALGVDAVTVVPFDRRLRRAADRGRIARRGAGRRAVGRLARRIESDLRP